MAPQPVIRPAAAADVPVLVRLLADDELSGDGEDPDALAPYERALEEISTTPTGELLVAEVDGEVVGMCQLVVFRHFQRGGGRCAEVESVHVRADCRSRGIGGALLEAAVARAVAAGCYRVQLTSNDRRPDAHRFYERHGFVPSHRGFKRPLG